MIGCNKKKKKKLIYLFIWYSPIENSPLLRKNPPLLWRYLRSNPPSLRRILRSSTPTKPSQRDPSVADWAQRKTSRESSLRLTKDSWLWRSSVSPPLSRNQLILGFVLILLGFVLILNYMLQFPLLVFDVMFFVWNGQFTAWVLSNDVCMWQLCCKVTFFLRSGRGIEQAPTESDSLSPKVRFLLIWFLFLNF